ncbi:SseB family protein [Rhodococcus sp. Q]|uniref:SseB family protein n=1 Tax=Rhodococcus sp. Q TaxID=2502252 RepID=UPI0010F575A7|nr:SseB family protein [Rhodococcus sp. Q]
MGVSEGGRAELRAEFEAFHQGFGHPASLTAALRDALLLLPVTDDDRILTGTIRGIDWLCVFTDEEQFATYLAARGETASARFRTLFGHRILDEILPALARPTGVVVDPAGAAPMAFPPDVEQVEL